MKKTISTSISGTIFHIEEDGYEILKQYLESIHQYFASFADNLEIIADIENRIAELLYKKIENNKQVITLEDVEELRKTLGTVDDFKTAEEEFGAEPAFEQTKSNSQKDQSHKTHSQTNSNFDPINKRFTRDGSRKVIAGVCAGLASYFEVDPVWIRLGFLASFFGLFFLPALSGVTLLIYIVLWIAMPVDYFPKQQTNLKKFFRDGEKKVIGGVASGLAAYFNIDVVIIRALFVLLLLLGGSGFFIYIILWIASPEAKSVTDRMQMAGEPITLNSIEENIRRNIHFNNPENEKLMTKILMFPFRVLAMIVDALGPIFLFILTAARVFLAIILFILSLSLIFTIMLAVGVLFQILPDASYVHIDGFSVLPLLNEISPYLVSAAFFVALIPTLCILMLAISLVFKKFLLKGPILYLLITVWFLGIFGLLLTLPPYLSNFQKEGNFETKTVIASDSAATLLMDVKRLESSLDPVHLTIEGYDGKEVQLVQEFNAHGKTYQEAEKNAACVSYQFNMVDSVLFFNEGITLPDSCKFRDQQLRMKMKVPFGKKFKMSPKMGRILLNTLTPAGYNTTDLGDNVWIFDKSKGLRCLTCVGSEPEEAKSFSGNEEDWDRPVNADEE